MIVWLEKNERWPDYNLLTDEKDAGSLDTKVDISEDCYRQWQLLVEQYDALMEELAQKEKHAKTQ